MNIFLRNILASWWKRILVFLILISLSFIITYESIELLPVDFVSSIFLILILISSSIIECLRIKSQFYLFGITLTRNITIDIIQSLFMLIIVFSSTLLITSVYTEIRIVDVTNNHFISILFSIAIVSIIEELIFRGIIFQALIENFGNSKIIILSSVIFALSHLANPNFTGLSFFNTFLAGVLLGNMYIQTKSLYAPIVFHIFWNIGLVTILGTSLSGYKIINLSFISIDYNSLPDILFGGDYGFEGGIFATILLLFLIAYSFKLKPSPFVSAKLYKREIEESQL